MSMIPEEEFRPVTEQTEASPTSAAEHRSRRSSRGHRGRGRRRKPKQPQPEQPVSEPFPEQPEAAGPMAPEPEAVSETGEAAPEMAEGITPEAEAALEAEAAEEAAPPVAGPARVVPMPKQPQGPSAPRHRPEPAPRATVQRAIAEVNQIIETLREALDDMEGVLELLEQLERQGEADEHEVESLRRALRQLQRPRDGGHSARSHRGRS